MFLTQKFFCRKYVIDLKFKIFFLAIFDILIFLF